MPEAKPVIQPIPTYARKDAEYLRRVHAIDVPLNFDPKHLTAPETWAHLGAEFKVWDRIEARAVDGTWFAELLVTATARTWAKTAVLNFTSLTSADVSLSEAIRAEMASQPQPTPAAPAPAMKVMHRGPRAWSVVRESDKAVLAEDLQTKQEAEQRMADLAKTAVTT